MYKAHWVGITKSLIGMVVFWSSYRICMTTVFILKQNCSATWTNPENTLSGRSQSQKTTYGMTPFKWNIENRHQRGDRSVFTTVVGVGQDEDWLLTGLWEKRCSDITSDVCTTLWVYENSLRCTLVKVNFIACELCFNKVTIFKKFAELPEKCQ